VFYQRVISGVILGALTVAIIVAGGPIYTLVAYLIFAIVIVEYSRLVDKRRNLFTIGLRLVWLVLFWVDAALPDAGIMPPGTALLLLVTMAWMIINYRSDQPEVTSGFAMTIAGAFYIGWSGSHLVKLRLLEDGLFWTLSVILTTWAVDTFSYLVGSVIGKHPFSPKASPKKTWEGYIGGVILGTAFAALIPLAWSALGAQIAISPLHGFILGLLISVLSPLGDVGISIFKRYADVKNSGRLIPGHGGLFDRTDTMIWSILLGYYYLVFFVI
jgi:phosphatidate cytidylyltransferase